jgi:hypothetical protein
MGLWKSERCADVVSQDRKSGLNALGTANSQMKWLFQKFITLL